MRGASRDVYASSCNILVTASFGEVDIVSFVEMNVHVCNTTFILCIRKLKQNRRSSVSTSINLRCMQILYSE